LHCPFKAAGYFPALLGLIVSNNLGDVKQNFTIIFKLQLKLLKFNLTFICSMFYHESMKLDAYLKKRNISVSNAAEVLGYSRQRLYQVLSGTSQPGRVLALRIVDWSKGQVTLKDLITDSDRKDDLWK